MLEIPGMPAIEISGEPRTNKKLFRSNNAWTILLLTPPGFVYDDTIPRLAMDAPLHTTALQLIADCVTEVAFRWAGLRTYLEHLLNERKTIHQPDDHDKLLWDDEVFTRSRRYFWAIHCLEEFHLSISDNIKQWEEYHEARVAPMVRLGLIDSEDKDTISDIENTCAELRDIRHYFAEQKVATTALRDGVSVILRGNNTY